MEGRQSIGDHTELRGRSKCVIFSKDWREEFLLKFLRLEHDVIVLWVVVEAMTFDHDVCTTGI